MKFLFLQLAPVQGLNQPLKKYLVTFHQKAKLEIKKVKSKSDFGGFKIARSEKKKSKIHQFSILGFQCVAKILKDD